jgi:hypothetical protein
VKLTGNAKITADKSVLRLGVEREMNRPQLATKNDAPLLPDLFCKLLRATGMDRGNCEEENHERLIAWLESRCEEDRLWIIEREGKPAVLAWFDSEKKELIGIAVIDGVERQGYRRRDLIAWIEANTVSPSRAGSAAAS